MDISRVKVFSIKDAAQALGIHPKTIRRWEKSGKFIPQRTPGNQRRFSPDDILKLKKLQLAPNPIPAITTPGVKDVHTPGVNLWTKYTHFLSLTALIIVLFLAGYLFYQNSSKIASPTIQQLDLNKQDVQIAMPQVANFLNGQITIGSDTGTLSFLDQKGNLYLKNSALVEGVIQTTALQFAPSAKPDNQLGRQYVDKTTGNLMYFDGLDWVTLNQAASQSANLNSSLATNSALPLKILGSADQAIMTIDENSAYPVLFSQPTKVLANFYANKFIDSDSSSYFLDPSASVISLSVAGNATISSNLTFSAYGESITNSVDNYLVFSGGLGIGGITSYGFSPDFKVKAKNAQVDDELVISNLKLTTNKIEALNNDGIKLYDNAGYGLYIKDGGNVTINGVDLLVPDYVFDTNYQLLSPIDLEEFTKIHHHLPNVASADEIKASGLNLSQFILQLLQQVENNVLYILDLNKRLTVIEQKEALVLASPSPSLVASINEPNLTAIIKDKINDLTQKYADQMATGAAGPLATNSAVLAASEPASPSAYLDIDSVNANAGFFKDYLAVIGQTTVTSLKVNNLLSVDSISSLSGRLNLLAGLMTLDDSGNVIIKGNLNVTGAIVASQINTPQDAALQMNIASASALIIYNDIGEPLATFSGQSAQFNQLSLNNSGSATVSAGENNVVVASDKLTPNSQIIVTFNSNYTPASKYWVIKDVAKKEFTVFTNYPVNNDSPIDWLIIN